MALLILLLLTILLIALLTHIHMLVEGAVTSLKRALLKCTSTSACMHAGPDVTLSYISLYRHSRSCWGHTYKCTLVVSCWKKSDDWHGVSGSEPKTQGVQRGVGPGISFCDSSALLLQLRDAFWVLAAGRGAGCQTEDGDKERLEEEGRDHIYFHHHLYLITCSCFVLSLISSSPGCLQPSGMQKHTAHTHVYLYICTRLLSYLNIQIHGRC